jgi:hypothetical protein
MTWVQFAVVALGLVEGAWMTLVVWRTLDVQNLMRKLRSI